MKLLQLIKLKNYPIFLLVLVWISSTETFGGMTDQHVPWCKSLAYGGGGYWTVRVPIAVKNN
jgi:hypothetical protein